MSHTVTYPVYETRSGWNALLPKRSINSARKVESRYDFVVIGAGFTGLATARRLAELNPRASVLVLEASEVGEGSSARNSGFIISLPHNTRMSGHASPAQLARKQIRIYESGLAWLKTSIDTHGIECGWNPVGKYHGAATPDGVKNLQSAARQYDSWEIAYAEISKAELVERTGTSYYQYGLHTMNNVFVQPAALIRGLADSLPSNVTLVEHCPVLSVDGTSQCLIRTKDRDIKAGKLILANNGYAKKLGFLKDRLITIFTYAGMTPELDDQQLALHGTDPEWGLIPANRLGTTLRRIQNRRFMVRSAYSYEKAQTQAAVYTMLTDCYRRRYPGLCGHRLEHVWGGVTALTRNGATFFGKASGNMYASVGCNGAGVLKGSVYGKLLAELILNQDSQELSDVLAMETPSWLPPEPIRRVAVLTAIHLQKKKAGAER